MGKNDDNPSDEARFIFGNCNPVILVPGMLSTKLQVKINCKGLYNDEIDKFKKMRFYCGSELCSDINNTNESRDLFISVIGPFQLVEYDNRNKYAACTGYFLTFFNSKNACASYDEKNDDYICNYSENIKIGFYGFRTSDKNHIKCGLNAIKDVVLAEGNLGPFVNKGVLRSFGPLIELEENAINSKNLEVLTDILENGSVEVYNIEHNKSTLADKQQDVICSLRNNGLLNEKSLISRYYGGIYFSYRQAVWIDIILEAINRNVPKYNRDLYLAALLSTASDIVDTVGKHFAQPIKARDSNGKIKNTVYNKAVKDKTIDVVP
jgi:hypothetical protein